MCDYCHSMTKCEIIKCPNYEVCSSDFPKCIGNCHQNRCINCDIIFGNIDLVFSEQSNMCDICYISNQQVKLPDCSHYTCIECFKQIYFFDETKYYLNPEKYGCPSCPNDCNNPDRGTQCYCEEYDSIKDTWAKDFPEQYENWNNDEDNSINNITNLHGHGKCPFCRSEIHQNWLH